MNFSLERISYLLISRHTLLMISNNNFILRRNGTQLTQTASYTFTLTSGSLFQIGYRASAPIFLSPSAAGRFVGYIGEIVAFNTQLVDIQRQQIEGYLAWKWGLRSSLPTTHPYYNFPPSP